jgi:hypothetical protein
MFKTIIIQNKIINIYSNPSESNDMFISRVRFILINLNKFKNLNECISYSIFYQNILYYSCSYPVEIHKKIDFLSSTI